MADDMPGPSEFSAAAEKRMRAANRVPTPRADPRSPSMKALDAQDSGDREVRANAEGQIGRNAPADRPRKPYTVGEHLLAAGRAAFEGDKSVRRQYGKGPGQLYDREAED